MQGKDDPYYANVRQDVLDVLPGTYRRALEIGCGAGGTLAKLKADGLAQWVGGVEPSPAAKAAAAKVDKLWPTGIEQALADPDFPQVDLMLCLDVIEHLIDPWEVTARLVEKLAPNGTFVASLPNIQYYKYSLPLVLNGVWEYEKDGIMDSTHLRFFTRSSACKLLTGAGLSDLRLHRNPRLKRGKNKWLLVKLFGDRLADLYANQFILVATKRV